MAVLATYISEGLFDPLNLDNFIACAMGKANPRHSISLHQNRNALGSKSPKATRTFCADFAPQGIFMPRVQFWHFMRY